MAMKYCNLILTTIILTITTTAYAGKSTIEKYGDVVQILVPLTAYATTFYLDDTQGRSQFYKSFLTTVISTQSLKHVVQKKRPNHNGSQSFPSGHTSTAFQGAAFIQKRYGWRYGLPAYVAASFVGYSRIEDETRKHDLIDVFAGAAIGTLSSYYFTTPYQSVSITPYVVNGITGVSLSINW